MEAKASRGRPKKLIVGARVAILTPKFSISCQVCESFIWKPDGSVQRLATGEPMARTSQEIPTRCQGCPKVPRGVRESGAGWKECRRQAIEITPENAQALCRYKEFRATHEFPDDAIVRWYAAIIREIEDERDRSEFQELSITITHLAAILAMRRR